MSPEVRSLGVRAGTPGGACRGFSLIELSVVFVILGLAITMLAYSGLTVSRDGRDAAAIASLDRVSNAERATYGRLGRYTPYPGDLRDQLGRDLTAVTANVSSTVPNQVSIAVGEQGTLAMAVKSQSGACFARQIQVAEKGGASVFVKIPDTGACAAASALPVGEPLYIGPTGETTLLS